MWNLPDKMPFEAYEAIGRRCGLPASFLVALARKETIAADEDPRWIRFEARPWRRTFRLNVRELRRFDRSRNARTPEARWEQFWEMHNACQREGQHSPQTTWAAVKSHSFTAFQVMGFNHDEIGYADPANFFDDLKTVDGHVRIISRFFRSTPRLGQLAARWDLTARTFTAGGRVRAAPLGDASEFAHHYNGPAYRRNNYDTEIARIRADVERRYA